ncbi:hypothetical protein D3H35_16555 [Cohnella faecalis]|uniref:PBP domain-containing protein n=1 Tax=Cohnella faecalis TaxID=2315694 RepID=A0A398CNM5_9BACL|nr:hypothetical protein D3H35_16555 [Cohnella faecalis]
MNPRLIRKLSLTAVLSLSVTAFAACSSGSKSNGGAEEAAPTQSDYTKAVELVNASTDGTEPLYAELNAGFVLSWKSRTGQTVTVRQETGASSEQEQAIIKGDSKADVVTLGIGTDIDAIQTAGVVGKAGSNVTITIARLSIRRLHSSYAAAIRKAFWNGKTLSRTASLSLPRIRPLTPTPAGIMPRRGPTRWTQIRTIKKKRKLL